ncbi:hypothetical protein [Flavobacterium sp. XS2P39]|uniref:hypothetical protein n=1 Tax=Flavobacterium sp. XS2P39 TaxID=3401725 RepID=UPI003AAAC06C
MDILIELLINERQKLSKRIIEVDKKLSELGYSLHGLIQDNINDSDSVQNPNNETDKSRYSNFKKDGSIREQALEVLKTENRFLSKKEIVEIILPFHKSRGIEKLTSRVTSELSNAKEKIENLIAYQFSSSKQSFVWGNKSWLDENGKPKPEHMYKIDENKEQTKIFEF